MSAVSSPHQVNELRPTPAWEQILDEVGFESRGDEQLRETLFHLWVIMHYTQEGSSRILLNGPTGSGKELIAHAAHKFLPGDRGNFVTVNCSTLNEGTATSELFGSKKGSYTGSNTDKTGYFQLARNKNDTIFLDEIHKLHPVVRPQLYRVLNERTFHSLGAPDHEQKFEGSVISAASSSIDAMRDDGTFPQDLFSRLAQTGEVRISGFDDRPPEHRRILISHGFERWTTSKAVPQEDVIEALLKIKFPGGIRDLRSIITQLSSYAAHDVQSTEEKPQVRKEHLEKVLKHWPKRTEEPSLLSFHDSLYFDLPNSNTLKDFEQAALKLLLQKLAQQFEGSVTQIAEAMGITRGTLRNKTAALLRVQGSKLDPGDYIRSLWIQKNA